ncbi:MAG: hypothetical protein QOE90_2826 [Thermoplasmata archaeon]|jgi:uncharacterized OsmC-like protein|nr:hypothetical protein [Thermoplasmata archaeon]
MPNVYGKEVYSVKEIVAAFREFGDKVRGTYRVRYVFDAMQQDPYGGASLERPEVFAGMPRGAVFPWEAIYVAAANCAGSDYPMIAEHEGIPIDRVELDLSGVFDPRGEFTGLDGWTAPADAKGCYLSLHVRTTLTSDAPRDVLQRLHDRVVSHNMVLGALRGVPLTHELVVKKPMRGQSGKEVHA